MGKTALLAQMVRRASECLVLHVEGLKSETDLQFAGLQRLCEPLMDRLEAVVPQQDALTTACGTRAGDRPNIFLVGTAALNLFESLAREVPVICVADDAQWLDQASMRVLSFVARRLRKGPFALVLATREPDGADDFTGIPDVEVRGLSDEHAAALLAPLTTGPLDERVRDRLIAETQGNPSLILEHLHGLTPEQLAGGFGMPDPLVAPGKRERWFREEFETLPQSARMILLVVAAEPMLDQVAIERALGHLSLEMVSAAPGIAAGLVEFDGRLRFCHPDARSAVYRAASPAERRVAHQALAQSLASSLDCDRRAWHQVHATPEADERLALELDGAVNMATTRGGLAAAAAFRERAAAVSVVPASKARRTLAAAQLKYESGSLDSALRLLTAAESGSLDQIGHAQVSQLRARIAADLCSGPDALAGLLDAAKEFQSIDVDLARESIRDSFYEALSSNVTVARGRLIQVGNAMCRYDPTGLPASAPTLETSFLDGLRRSDCNGGWEDVPALKLLLREIQTKEITGVEDLRYLLLGCRVANEVWDHEASCALTTRLIELSRSLGALTVLPTALLSGISVRLLAGKLEEAQCLTRLARTIIDVTSSPVASGCDLLIAAWRGQEQAVTEARQRIARLSTAGCEGERWQGVTDWATAVLHNGLCSYEKALSKAEQALVATNEIGAATWSMVEFVEAASRCGELQRGRIVLEQLSHAARAGGGPWALGVEACSRAVLNDGRVAEDAYRESIELLGESDVIASFARAHLLFGEWLRREKRRVEARDHLRVAHEIMTMHGFHGFAERARRELLATGEKVRRRSVDTLRHLTPQEAEVAHLAGDRRTNREIAEQLFISERTVEWHLRKVYMKLGIGSRRELNGLRVPLDT